MTAGKRERELAPTSALVDPLQVVPEGEEEGGGRQVQPLHHHPLVLLVRLVQGLLHRKLAPVPDHHPRHLDVHRLVRQGQSQMGLVYVTLSPPCSPPGGARTDTGGSSICHTVTSMLTAWGGKDRHRWVQSRSENHNLTGGSSICLRITISRMGLVYVTLSPPCSPPGGTNMGTDGSSICLRITISRMGLVYV